MIRKSFLIVLTLTTLACGSQKETAQEKEAIKDEIAEVDTDTATNNYRVVGIVQVSETDCPLYIEAKGKDKTMLLYPMNLDPKFQRDGMRLKFDYALSKGAQPANCEVDAVVTVSDVTLMR